jgi:hypothetical protein
MLFNRPKPLILLIMDGFVSLNWSFYLHKRPFYAIDRDNRRDRVKSAYDVIVKGQPVFILIKH